MRKLMPSNNQTVAPLAMHYFGLRYLVLALGPAVPDTDTALGAARHAPDGWQEVDPREPGSLLDLRAAHKTQLIQTTLLSNVHVHS